MKKLIGMSLVALLVATTSNADAQIFSKFRNKDTKVKEKVDDQGQPYLKVKHGDGHKTTMFSHDSYYGYTTVKNKSGKHKSKTTHAEPYTVTKYKKGNKVKTKSGVKYTTVKRKNGKYKMKPEQYATSSVKTKGSKHKSKL